MKKKRRRSVSHRENERQPSVNNFWSCKSGNTNAIWYWLHIIEVLPSIIGKEETITHPAPSWKCASTECQRSWAFNHGLLKRAVSVKVPILSFGRFCSLKYSWTLSCTFVHDISCYCSGGYRGNITCIFAYTGCQPLVYRHVRLSAS